MRREITVRHFFRPDEWRRGGMDGEAQAVRPGGQRRSTLADCIGNAAPVARLRRMLAAGAIVACSLAPMPALAFDAGEVVVSIKPLHSLVAAVMDGVGMPALIVKGGGSPHSYSLRPSEARALDGAKVVFLVSPETLETFLAGPLAALASGAEVVELGEADGVMHLAPRESDSFEAHDHAGEAEGMAKGAATAAGDDHEGHAHGAVDPHLWLDPANGRAMVPAIVVALSRADPDHAALYAANGDKLAARIADATVRIEAKIAPVRGRPFIVFHDAYQYFEKRFGLAAAGAVTLNPQAQPGARGIAHIRERIAETGAVCVFSEPQFEPRIVTVVTEGTGARSGMLDPIGADLADGPELYFKLLERNADALVGCLSGR
ncbi:MAG: zinc ABC transporter substrate-binding protein [Hyphomicrobiales bacterium]